jgi:hypothetical protein
MKQSLLALFIFAFTGITAQISTPRPSPTETLSQKVGLTDVTITYSRPSVKGRKIFGGDVVPFGKIWRTGANEPTKLSFSDSVTIEGRKLAAGDYALYTIPGENEWTVILGKNTTVQAGDYKDDMEAARFQIKPMKMDNQLETFTMDLADLTMNSANLQISWERTTLKFKIETEVDRKVMAAIKDKLDDTNPYYQAASYYYDTNKDLKQALAWVNRDLDKKPRFFVMTLKAKIQAKMKDCKGAVETSKKAIELAKAAKNDDFVRQNEKLIADCK